MLPVPEAWQTPPLVAEQVHAHALSGAANVSLTVARLTGSGPALDAVIV